MLHSLWFKSFRCLNENLISFNHHPFISIVSKNNVGKTSLLEACYILGNLSSFVTSKLGNTVSFGEEASYIGVKLKNLNNEINYYLKIDSKGKKYISLNNRVVRNKKDIQSLFRVNYISSDSLFFVMSQPAFRRSNLDQSISQFSLTYRQNIATFKRLIMQKNKLLKTNQDSTLIKNLNQLLAPLIFEIRKERLMYLNDVQLMLNRFLSQLSFPLDSIQITYNSKIEQVSTSDDILTFLNQNLHKEQLNRVSLFGPQRDDYRFYSNGRLIKEFCSRGVCRTISYFFQLSHSCITKEKTKLPCLLLLDEPFSEIYRDLKFDLIQLIPDSFFKIYTSTQQDEISSLKETKLYAIKNGQLCTL